MGVKLFGVADFKELRRCEKVIKTDVRFNSMGIKTVLRIPNIPVENPMALQLYLGGHVNKTLGQVGYNFHIEGRGPICRLEINANVHRDAGRNHKHEPRSEEDFDKNLPFAIPMPYLAGHTARELWVELCSLANIKHLANFIDP